MKQILFFLVSILFLSGCVVHVIPDVVYSSPVIRTRTVRIVKQKPNIVYHHKHVYKKKKKPHHHHHH